MSSLALFNTTELFVSLIQTAPIPLVSISAQKGAINALSARGNDIGLWIGFGRDELNEIKPLLFTCRITYYKHNSSSAEVYYPLTWRVV